MLLYIHVPFCRRKCHYCSFHSQVPADNEIEEYVHLLLQEIWFWQKKLGNTSISSIYLGGGTPSLLSTPQLKQIVSALRQSFSLESNLEFTLEANPDSLNKNFLQGLPPIWINRLSLGIQSFNDEQLFLLGRLHKASQAVQAYKKARAAGFSNISLDFIWGLPGQSLKQWMTFLGAAVKLRPEHLSCYGLSIEPGTALYKSLQEDKLNLPSEDECARMYIYGAEYLESEGYIQYEISNFARMGYMSMHNSGYWERLNYLGLGPGAVSTMDNMRWQNPRSITQYKQQIQTGQIGSQAEQLEPEIQTQEMVMLGLRTSKGLDLQLYRQLSGNDFCKKYSSLLGMMHKNGLIRINRGRLRLTKNGMLVSNSIISSFL